MGNSTSNDAPGVCSACTEPLSDQYILAGNKSYHSACFKCESCKQELGAVDFIDHEGAIYCEKCYSHQFSSKCDLCEEPILSGKSFSALGRDFHAECFVCAECSTPCTDGQQFYSEVRNVARRVPKRSSKAEVQDDGSQEVKSKVVLFCRRCNFADQKGSGQCSWCQQEVEDNGIFALGKRWHQECFVCNDCESPLLEDGNVRVSKVPTPFVKSELLMAVCAQASSSKSTTRCTVAIQSAFSCANKSPKLESSVLYWICCLLHFAQSNRVSPNVFERLYVFEAAGIKLVVILLDASLHATITRVYRAVLEIKTGVSKQDCKSFYF